MRNPLMKKSIIITIISLVIFSFLATLYTNNLSRNLYDETNEFLKEIAIQTASSINNRMNENITQLDTIALMIHTNNTVEKKLLDYLNELAIESNIKRFGIADLAGNVRTSDQQVFNIKDRDYFQKSLHGEKVKSNSMKDFVDGEQIIVYSVPLYNKDDQINGVFFATYDTVKLSKTLDNASFNNTGYSFIFNESGDIILLSTQAEDVKNIKTIQDLSQQKDIKIESIDKQGSGIISFTDHNNSHNYFTYANIKNNDWLVASVFPQEVVTDRIQNLIITAFITWLLIGLGSAFLLSYTYFIQKKNKLQLTKLAFEDSLTQHYNFNKFIELCKNNSHLDQYVLINCDIKGFKWFNEIYGEDIANNLLMTIMKCIDNKCHMDELCCRQKDDHFAILFKKNNPDKLRERLFNLADQIRYEFNKLQATSQFYFHFGVYEIIDKDIDIKVAFQKTQYIKNDFKQLSQDDVILYQEDVFQKDLHDQQIEKDFLNDLENQDFKVYIQPKVDIKTGNVLTGEALVRWQNAEHGLISPGVFIPIFEKNGMLESLDVYVFQQILRTLEHWRHNYHKDIGISVNVSRTYLFNEGFIDQFIQLVLRHDIHPSQIEVEITETTALNHKSELIDILNKLRKHEIRVALDDFGSGYSSLNMLKDFPIDVVKIDQEFFKTTSSTYLRSHIIIEEVIELCHKLNIVVVAEGVETQEQKDFLVKHHCNYIQGYYYYKPMPIQEFEDLFIKNAD